MSGTNNNKKLKKIARKGKTKKAVRKLSDIPAFPGEVFVWGAIENCNERDYGVSNFSRCWSFANSMFVSTREKNKGRPESYLELKLTKNGKYHYVLVHRFAKCSSKRIPYRSVKIKGLHCHHINHNHRDNRTANTAFVTPQVNNDEKKKNQAKKKQVTKASNLVAETSNCSSQKAA